MSPSLQSAIQAVNDYCKGYEDEVDRNGILQMLTAGDENLWDLWDALGQMPARDEKLEALYEGLTVLVRFWDESRSESEPQREGRQKK